LKKKTTLDGDGSGKKGRGGMKKKLHPLQQPERGGTRVRGHRQQPGEKKSGTTEGPANRGEKKNSGGKK